VAGSGEFLARRLAQRLVAPGGTIIGLNEAWGPVASSAGCAHALLVLASERPPRGEGDAIAGAAEARGGWDPGEP
jgi:hypothetical protein